MAKQAMHLKDIKLAWGLVRHQRELPKPNGFSTGACFVRLVFGAEKPKHALPKYPVIDGTGLVSVSAASYGMAPHSLNLPEFVADLRSTIEKHSGQQLAGDIHLHTFPKILGYVFNPVSFWYFHDHAQQCKVVLCEVNNTFGERHFYLLQNPQSEAPLTKGMLLHATKAFHVSPFFPVSGRYEFRFVSDEQRTMARINYMEGDTLQLSTSVSGALLHPSPTLWGRTLIKYGWFTVAVVVKIHWQAVKLFLKGARFHSKPTPPNHSISQTEIKA